MLLIDIKSSIKVEISLAMLLAQRARSEYHPCTDPFLMLNLDTRPRMAMKLMPIPGWYAGMWYVRPGNATGDGVSPERLKEDASSECGIPHFA